MESILLLAIVGKNGGGGGGGAGEEPRVGTLEDLKSPVIPYPPDLESPDGPRTLLSGRVLTERTLRNSHLAWMIRKRNLAARLEALETAWSLGLANTWAGDASEVHCRSVREAVLEAGWVEDKLKEAVRWCNERPIKPVSVRQLLKGVKHGHRPSHIDYPLVLHDLPFPLPVAPASSVYTLTVERPPPIDVERTDHERELDAPPTYSFEADCSAGETSIERGADVMEYQRRIDGSLLADRASRNVIATRVGLPTYWG